MADGSSIERRIAAAATAFAAIWAFTNAPALRLSDPGWVSVGGTCFAFGAAGFWLQSTLNDIIPERWYSWFLPLALLLLGGGILTWQEAIAQNRIEYTSGQCRALETEMLASPKMREADAAAFVALQCGYSLQAGDVLRLGS